MADFYIVPPRLTVGSFDRADAVTSLNSLKGDITITADPSTGLRVSISSGQFAFSITPDFYIKKSGDTVPGNIRFTPSGSNYGLAVAAGVANPGTGTTGALFLNTADGKLKYHDGWAWQDITAVAGIALTTADLRYLKLDGTNTPTANISMGSQFLRFANLATQILAGSAGQVFYNTDTNKLNVYNGASWTAVGSGISSITVGIGLTTATNPIVDSGTIDVDQAYDFTWTGSHTFNNVVNFSAAGQTFAASKLFIAGQTAGDLIYYSGSSWVRLGIGSTNQVLSVNSAGNAITWAASTGGGGAGTVYNGSQYSIPYYPATGTAITGSVNFQNTGTGISIAYTTASTGISSGALTVLGGVGIGGSLYTSSAFPNSISGLVLNNGVITSGSWAGNTITAIYGGTGNTSYTLGDLLVGAGSTFIKLPVGINSYVLGADSSRPSGVGWTSVTPLTISDTPPASPKNADLWFNSVDGGLLVYYSDVDTNQWVEIALGSGIDLSQPVNITNTTASTSTTTGALIVDGGAGFASTIYAPVISINGIYDQISSTLTTSSTTADQVAMSLGATVYRTLKLNVQMTSSTSYHSQEILMVHDGTLVYMTEYAIVNNGSILSTFDADISGGNIRLLVSPTNAVTTYKIACSAIRI